MDTEVVIVWGCPGSGKTTYVKKHMKPGDMVVDLDYIKQSISMTGKTEARDNYLNVALSIREHLYELIEYRELINSPTVWIVAGLPNKDDREYLFNRLLADRMIHIKATKRECIQRAMNDKERKDKEIQLMIIDKWFRQYTK